MIRTFVQKCFLAIAISVTFLGGLPMAAHAKVCSPACTGGQNCAYTNVAQTQTGCVDPLACTGNNCAGGEVTITAAKTPAAVAAPAPSGPSFGNIVSSIISLVNGSVLPLLFALAFVFFLVNIVRYFFIEGGTEGQKKGKDAAMYGLIGLVVLFSVWGIVNLLLNTLNSFAGVSGG